MRGKSALHRKEKLAWSRGLAYAVGLLATDGNLSSDRRRITLTSSDVEQLETFQRCLHTNLKLSRNSPGSFSTNISYRVQFSNAKLYQQLLDIGLSPRKTGSLGELKIPRAFYPDFLRGVIDGDGSIVLYTDRYNVYKGKRYEYLRIYVAVASASLHFLRWIQETLRRYLKTRGSLTQQATRPWATKPAWKLRFAKQDSIKILHWIYYNDRLPCLARKRVLAQRALDVFSSFHDKRFKRSK
jgi:hypothetical protein